MSHAMFLDTLDTGGMWSVARGLGRSAQAYKKHLAACELPRSELESVTGTGDRQARRIAASLGDLGVLTSESSRAPLRIAFPATLASRWMPGLFPDKA